MELLVTMLIGATLGMIGITLGAYMTIKTGQYYIENYVQKLTPEDVQKLNNIQKEDISEEALWASDLTENEYRRMMGWDKETETPTY